MVILLKYNHFQWRMTFNMFETKEDAKKSVVDIDSDDKWEKWNHGTDGVETINSNDNEHNYFLFEIKNKEVVIQIGYNDG